jgi:hypothetical protein
MERSMPDEKKANATHARSADGSVRILSAEERKALDEYALDVLVNEWDELGRLVTRVSAADRIDERDGILFVADVRGTIGAWMLEAITEGRVSADEYSAQASCDRRFAPVVAQFWSQDEAAEHVPRIAPGALEQAGPRLEHAIRVIVVNKKNQVAVVHREVDTDG